MPKQIRAVLRKVDIERAGLLVVASSELNANTTSLAFGAALAVTYFATEKMDAWAPPLVWSRKYRLETAQRRLKLRA